MVTLEKAIAVVDAIIEEARNIETDTGFKLYLYGSTVNGHGRDIDIIIEVSEELFEQYKGTCLFESDGIVPYSNRLLTPFPSHYWSYFSPQVERSKHALSTIGVEQDSIVPLLGDVILDAVCLPEGWNNPESEIFMRLMEDFEGMIDPNFLVNAAKGAKQMYPC